MNEGEGLDTVLDPQASVWPPPPTAPVPQIDSHAELVEAITRSIKWSSLLFVAGCISPLLIFIVCGLLLHLSDKVTNILHNCIWPPVYLAAAYHARQACLLARRVGLPGLVTQGGILIALSLLFVSVLLWLSIFG